MVAARTYRTHSIYPASCFASFGNPLLFLYFISLGRIGHKKIEINTLWLFFFIGILAFKHEIPGSHAFTLYQIVFHLGGVFAVGFQEL